MNALATQADDVESDAERARGAEEAMLKSIADRRVESPAADAEVAAHR